MTSPFWPSRRRLIGAAAAACVRCLGRPLHVAGVQLSHSGGAIETGFLPRSCREAQFGGAENSYGRAAVLLSQPRFRVRTEGRRQANRHAPLGLDRELIGLEVDTFWVEHGRHGCSRLSKKEQGTRRACSLKRQSSWNVSSL